jgi:predicted dehydrogenase
MIGVGIVGTRYGCDVLLPAFRADPRCQVVALAGTDGARTAERAKAAGIAKTFRTWEDLIVQPEIDVLAVATPPALQPQIAVAALQAGKPVLAEKPLAGDGAAAADMLAAARASGLPTGVDFNFHRIVAWQAAKRLLDDGAIGPLRHVTMHWHVENRATRLRLDNWKTRADTGGGVLGNFASHTFHYLEWFCGPVASLSARLAGLPDAAALETTAMLTLDFDSGIPASVSVSCGSYLGPGHRLEFYGEDGTLVLENATSDYMRGFELRHARRPAAALTRIAVDDPDDALYADGRIAPTARIVRDFIAAVASRAPDAVKPDFSDGYRVQRLIDAARRSHAEGRRVPLAIDPDRDI